MQADTRSDSTRKRPETRGGGGEEGRKEEGEGEAKEEAEEEEEEGTFLKERAGRAGGRSLSCWLKASKCIDRWGPTG